MKMFKEFIMSIKKSVILILFIFFLSIGVKADNALQITGVPNSFELTGHIQQYKGITANSTIEKISSDSSLFSLGQNSPQLTPDLNIYWIKTTIKNYFNCDKEYVLFFDDHWDQIDFYSLESNIWKHQITGELIPFRDRSLKIQHAGVQLILKKGETQTFYAKLVFKGNWLGPESFIDNCMEQESFLNERGNEKFIQGIFLGLILIMILYNLFLFFSIRDKNYLYYVIVLISTLLNFWGDIWYDFEFLLPQLPKLHRFLVDTPFYNTLGLFSTVIFAQSFLNTKQNLPKLHILMNMLLVLTNLILILSIFHITINGLFYSNINVAVVMSLNLVCGILLLRKGYRPAKFYVLGNIPFLIPIILFVLDGNFHFLPFEMKEYHMEIGSGIEIMFFSFALADRIKIMKGEISLQQEKIIIHLKETEILKDKVNRELESKVEERTLELSHKNQEITDSITYAKRIQQAMLPTHTYLHKTLKRLQKK